jgi:hypothetical protein
VSGLVRVSVLVWVPVSRWVSGAFWLSHPGTAATVVVPAERAQEPGQLRPVVDAQTTEDLLGRGPAGLLQTLQESVAASGQPDQNRAAVVGIGGPDDQPGGLDPVNQRGHRSGHDLEEGGDVSHSQRTAR